MSTHAAPGWFDVALAQQYHVLAPDLPGDGDGPEALQALPADGEHPVPEHRPRGGGRLRPTAVPAGG